MGPRGRGRHPADRDGRARDLRPVPAADERAARMDARGLLAGVRHPEHRVGHRSARVRRRRGSLRRRPHDRARCDALRCRPCRHGACAVPRGSVLDGRRAVRARTERHDVRRRARCGRPQLRGREAQHGARHRGGGRFDGTVPDGALRPADDRSLRLVRRAADPFRRDGVRPAARLHAARQGPCRRPRRCTSRSATHSARQWARVLTIISSGASSSAVFTRRSSPCTCRRT